jgi:hypothetical protein
MVLTAYVALSPVTGLFCHRRPQSKVLSKPGWAKQNSANLTPASGRQDHTILPSAATSLVSVLLIAHKSFDPPCNPVARKTLPRPPHPVPYVRDDRETPLCVGRDAQSSRSDLGCLKTEIFLQRGLDTPLNKPPDGQITTRQREHVPLVSPMKINPSFRGAPLGASPESITTTGSMGSGSAPSGASRNDSGCEAPSSASAALTNKRNLFQVAREH